MSLKEWSASAMIACSSVPAEYEIPTKSYGNMTRSSTARIVRRVAGFGHLIVFDSNTGQRIADASLNAPGAIGVP